MEISEENKQENTEELLNQLSDKETEFSEFINKAENSFVKKDVNDR
jgi:hypothetical protein